MRKATRGRGREYRGYSRVPLLLTVFDAEDSTSIERTQGPELSVLLAHCALEVRVD